MTGTFDGSHGSVGSTSSSLLDRVKARDDAAWRRLVRVYGPLILFWCRGPGIRREDRVDICQEVFRAVAANIDGFRRDEASGTFRGWLRTITRNKVVDHFRRQNRQPVATGGSAAQERFLEIPDGDPSSVPEAGDQPARGSTGWRRVSPAGRPVQRPTIRRRPRPRRRGAVWIGWRCRRPWTAERSLPARTRGRCRQGSVESECNRKEKGRTTADRDQPNTPHL